MKPHARHWSQKAKPETAEEPGCSCDKPVNDVGTKPPAKPAKWTQKAKNK